MNQPVDVLVVGGGIVGLTAALAMSKQHFSVVLLDAGILEFDAKVQEQDERVYAINDASKALLATLSAWQYLTEKDLSPYEKMYVWDAQNGAHIEFDARMVAAPVLGHIIKESALKKALLEAIHQTSNIQLLSNTKVRTIEERLEGINVLTKDSTWQAKLLMIADGANSYCRQLVNVPLRHWPYHQDALIATIKTEKPHENTAFQVFNPDGPLAFLPLKDGHYCSIVWSTNQKKADYLMAEDNEKFNLELEKAFASKLGRVELVGERRKFPLAMRHAKQYVGNHWLLLGDAAHTIHPLAGLGLNLGLADVESFLSCLKKTNNKISKKCLTAYQRERKASVWRIIAMMEGLKALFLNPLPPIIGLRGFGLRLCNQISPIKRFFIEHASGHSQVSR